MGEQGSTGSDATAGGPPSARVTARRRADRARYGRDVVDAILDAGLLAHVGVVTADGPVVLPMAYGRIGDVLYLHGAAANALLGAGADAEVCVTVTHLDGLVLARTAFHNSMNYRSVVVRGTGRLVRDPDEKVAALRAITDHVVATWDTGRPATASEIRQTTVLGVSLTESSAKVRTGDPIDDADDVDGPHWAGTVALGVAWGPLVPAADLAPGLEPAAPLRESWARRATP